ncbi:MAG: hypothetical protein J5669_04855 [Bacteroidales bacterium]|nr:hypothetical protein [Bacteroidales bacterium]
MNNNTKSILVRYGISTLGLIVVALGVGISIKSNLGIAPLSCIPTVLNLKFTHISIGTFTWAFNLLFIVIQAFILKKDFKWKHVMQVLPILTFGFLVDGAVWLFDAIQAPATNYLVQVILCLGAVVLTAVGIRLEVVGQGWILPADNLLHVITQRTGAKFAVVKVIMDVTLVAITVILALVFFGLLTGNGHTMVVREGTLIQAVLTGLCMHLTDPIINRWLEPVVARSMKA